MTRASPTAPTPALAPPGSPAAPVPALLRSEDEDDGEEDEDGMDDEDGLQDTEEDFEGDATEPEY